MRFEFHLPDIGEGLSEAEIATWLVAVGDHIDEDVPFVEIQTDKAIVEMPSPATGTVVSLGGGEGDIVRVGEILIVIDGTSSTGALAPSSHATPAAPGPESAASPSIPAESAAPGLAVKQRPRATPATRGLARRLGVDLATVAGSGPGGRISDADVQAAITAGANTVTGQSLQTAMRGASVPRASASPREDQRLPYRGIRRKTADTMTAAWQSVPHVNSFIEVDATDLIALRTELRPLAEADGYGLTLTAFFVKATALALRKFPAMNASLDLDAQEIVLHGKVNIGVAVSTPDGLVLPVIESADSRPLLGTARALAQATADARGRSLSLAAMSGSTFTISNYGPLGGWFGTSLVRNGEVGVLGFGPAGDRAWVHDGQLAIRKVMVISAGADHRAVDGEAIIGFVAETKRLLEHPIELLAERD